MKLIERRWARGRRSRREVSKRANVGYPIGETEIKRARLREMGTLSKAELEGLRRT